MRGVKAQDMDNTQLEYQNPISQKHYENNEADLTFRAEEQSGRLLTPSGIEFADSSQFVDLGL